MGPDTVALGLGANLGDARAALAGAVAALAAAPELDLIAVSPLYRTVPVGGPPQPDYANAVVVARSSAEPRLLLELARAIEAAFARTREVRWGPRTLDVDILAVSGVRSDDPDLTLPHPRAHLRAFVLVPWARIDPGFEVPGRGTVAELLAALPEAERAGVEQIAQGRWWEQQEVRP